MYIENHNKIYLCLIQKRADENGYVQTQQQKMVWKYNDNRGEQISNNRQRKKKEENLYRKLLMQWICANEK